MRLYGVRWPRPARPSSLSWLANPSMNAPFASNALRLNALRRAVVCTAWAGVWVAEARTVLRVWAADKAEQRLDWVVRAVQLALIASLVRCTPTALRRHAPTHLAGAVRLICCTHAMQVATYLACTLLAFSLDDMQRVSSSGPSTEGLAPMTQRPAPGFLVCEALRLLLHMHEHACRTLAESNPRGTTLTYAS